MPSGWVASLGRLNALADFERLIVFLTTLLRPKPSWLEKQFYLLVVLFLSSPAPPDLMGPPPSHCFPSTTHPCSLIPTPGHRSSWTCSAGKTSLAHKAELAPPGQMNKAPRGANLCSALCYFSFPFTQINRTPQRETNAFVFQGRTVRMARLTASC